MKKIKLFGAAFTLFFAIQNIQQKVYAQEAAVVISAHRGGAHEYDENTISAFKASYEAGLRGFETDIRITKDGELAIFHDADFKRIFGTEGSIESSTAAELRKMKTKKGNSVLFLDELLSFFKDKDGVYIEFEMKTKSDFYTDEVIAKYCDLLYQKVVKAQPKSATCLFTSFDKRPLKYIKTKYPTANLLFINAKGLSEDIIKESKELGVNYVGVRIEGTTRKMVQTAQKQGLKVTCWPGHNISDFILGTALGCDVICTDVPVQTIKFVKEKMPWIKVL